MYIPDNYDAYISYERENERLTRREDRLEREEEYIYEDEGEGE